MTTEDAVAGPKLGVKEAVKAARTYFEDIYREEHLDGVLLEEVDLSDDERVWNVTFGFDTNRPSVVSPTSVGPARAQFVRDYKTIQIDSSDGSLVAVKIRPV